MLNIALLRNGVSAEHSSGGQLEIGHVLFIDIVGYSKLLTNEQREKLQELNRIVRETEQFRLANESGKLLRLPAGDGMVLVFFTSPDAPARCAMAISRASHAGSDLPLRMGIHSGPVDHIAHVDDLPNLAGAGVNIAQRVMDCGDAGHILLSTRAADDLAQYDEWQAQLHPIGEAEVKHGVRIGLVSLYNNEIGNRELPQKIRLAEETRVLAAARQREAKRRRVLVTIGAAAVLFAAGIGGWAWQRHRQSLASISNVSSKSVAVLPFENLSTKEENAIFANGIHREILLDLAKVKDLKVISRTSVMQYKAGATRNLKEIARELGVSHVVEGSVQRERGHVRVTTQLIDANTDTPVWAEAYNRELADVFAIQSEIAQKITDQLGAHLSAKERAAVTSALTHNIEAYELYMKARILMDTDTESFSYADNFTKAVHLLETAVARDPQFVVAYCALAEANTQLFRDSRQKDCAPAERALQEARRIAPDASEVHFAQALIHYYCEHDFDRALATLELAARSLPNNAEIFTLRGLLERRLGRWEESLRHLQRAIELNPKDSVAYGHALGAAWALRRYDESRRITDAAIAAFPGETADGFQAWRALGALDGEGDVEGARRQLTNIRSKDSKVFLNANFYVAFAERNYAEAEKALTAILANEKVHRIDYAWAEASLAVATNRREEKRESWTAILATAAEAIAQHPDARSSPELKASALLHAALGNKQEAISMAKRAVELIPVSQDALAGPEMLQTLALVYTWTGENDLAFQTLFALAKMPHGAIHTGDLKLNPDWDNLRNDPHFADLVAEAAKRL